MEKQTFDELMCQIVQLDTLKESHIGQTITVAGWIHTARWQKDLIFIKLTDSADSKVDPFQIVIQYSSDPSYFDELTKVARGASVIIRGDVVKSPGKGQAIEMQGKEYFVIGHVADPEHYPLGGTASESMELLRSIPHLECHTEKKSSIYKIRSELMRATDLFFSQERYLRVDMPTITFSECEGGCQPMQVTLLLTDKQRSKIPTVVRTGADGQIHVTDDVDFSKDFFGVMASLTVSAQLELETQLPLGDVYTVTRAFRGEPSQTTRHLCEFSMIEIEKRFSRSAKDIMDVTEKYIKFCLQYSLDYLSKHIALLHTEKSDRSKTKAKKGDANVVEKSKAQLHLEKLQKYVDIPFVRITHAQAVEMMLQDVSDGKITFRELPSYEDDMASEHERYLTDVKYAHPIIVMRYPKAVKAFYMPVLQESVEESHGVEHVDSFDILVPDVGELVGGSQRIHRLEELEERIEKLRMDRTPLEFYIDLRRYGTTPHGGCGIGFERLIKFVTGVESVKDCVPYPRFLSCGKKQA